jgi:hypothetical protein
MDCGQSNEPTILEMHAMVPLTRTDTGSGSADGGTTNAPRGGRGTVGGSSRSWTLNVSDGDGSNWDGPRSSSDTDTDFPAAEIPAPQPAGARRPDTHAAHQFLGRKRLNQARGFFQLFPSSQSFSKVYR